MKGFLRAIYSPLSFDLLFATLAILCAILFIRWSAIDIPAIEAASNTFAKGAALTGTAIAGALLATVTTRFDQTWADDYVFQTLCKSALIGIMGGVFAMVLWSVLFAGNLGRVSAYSVLALLMVSWSASYFAVRLRGTGL